MLETFRRLLTVRLHRSIEVIYAETSLGLTTTQHITWSPDCLLSIDVDIDVIV
jgi:hypothetical protein